MKEAIKIVALSDTHSYHHKVDVPAGDVLVFAGDLMTCGRKFHEVMSFASWFMKHPHPHKVLVAGNHDRLFQSQKAACINEFKIRPNGDFHYLEDSGCVIRGWNFWGSPYTPWFYNWAFDYYRGDGVKHWNKIPSDTDILVTHGPPLGFGDQAIPYATNIGGIMQPPTEHVGCGELLNAVRLVKPAAHFFGHIHGGHGVHFDFKDQYNLNIDTAFHNVSICNEDYDPVNPAHTLWLGERE